MALSKLPPEQQAAYRKLQKKLQGDPQAQLALQLMLLDEREPHWNADELRSLPSRLLQSAFMEYANGAEWDCDPATDRSVTLEQFEQQFLYGLASERGLRRAESRCTRRSLAVSSGA